ncbi:MAG: DUF6272 family protein [Bacteroidota bacterium]|nr:DUF6272 family protein [Bacteroidota bacterium]
MSATNLILHHEKDFEFSAIEPMLTSLKEKLNTYNLEKIIIKKVFNIVVECVENIHKYTDWLKEYKEIDPKFVSKLSIEMITLDEGGEAFIIKAGNPIQNKNIEPLKGRIEHINSLSMSGLQKIHKFIIDKGLEEKKEVVSKGFIDRLFSKFQKINVDNYWASEKGGAGLGLIDIAQKSHSKLYYSFTPIDNEISYYELQIKFKIIVKNTK